MTEEEIDKCWIHSQNKQETLYNQNWESLKQPSHMLGESNDICWGESSLTEWTEGHQEHNDEHFDRGLFAIKKSGFYTLW